MLASKFNLDQRIAELRQVGDELRNEKAARASTQPAQSVAASIRSRLGWAPAARRTRLAAH